MYDQFGANEVGNTRQARFRLFIPDISLDTGVVPPQYTRGGLPGIVNIYAVGDFQDQIAGAVNWQISLQTMMVKSIYRDAAGHEIGYLYELTTPPLALGFYEYKYWIEYENPLRSDHFITDPCTRYAGGDNENGGFVIDGIPDQVVPSLGAKRKPYSDLVIYELMIDDFTNGIKLAGEAPIAAITRKLDYLQSLGVNAIEMMPWTAWTDDSQFNWGYVPYLYFSVAHRYTLDENDATRKLVHLKELVAECHRREMHVLMDGVFAHADPGDANLKGFPYYWLYQEPADSPYLDTVDNCDVGKHLDYNNRCTLEFTRDVCIYWIEQFGIDGIRFDETTGYIPGLDSDRGFAMLMSEIRAYLSDKDIQNFALVLEDSWDYGAVNMTNNVGGTSCWFYPLFWECQNNLGTRSIDATLMQTLNTTLDFQPGRTPTLFLENHDHRTFIVKAGGRDQWWRTQPYAIALLTCTGAILIHNGQEFSQYENFPEPGADSASDPRVISRPIQWDLLTDGPGGSTFAIYQKLISIRNIYPTLRSYGFYPQGWGANQNNLDANGFGVDTARQVVVYHRYATLADGSVERFYVVLNFSQTDQSIGLQVAENGVWEDLISGWKPQAINYQISFSVGSNWGHVFYQKS